MKYLKDLHINVVEAAGNYHQIGLLQSGECQNIRNQLSTFVSEVNADKVKERYKHIFPNLLEEMEGLSAGSGLPIDEILRLCGGYDLELPEMGCTALIQNGYYARNYDFTPDLYDARFVVTKPENGFAVAGFSQNLTGRLDGMNEKGLVAGLHFVSREPEARGFFAPAIVRFMLEQCSSVDEAVQLVTSVPHGDCYNFSVTDQSGKSIVIEASPQKQEVRSGETMFCTNHFQTAELKHLNKPDTRGSVLRQHELTKLHKSSLPAEDAYWAFNNRTSPLFFRDYAGYFGTLHTAVYSPGNLSIIIGAGEHCKPFCFSFEKYLNNKIELPKRIKGKIDFFYK